MAAITPIPSSRVSDLFMRQRLLSQLRVDQSTLLRLQTQLSTGRRIDNPSEDAPAALRATALQSLLERKAQVQVNLSISQSYLGVTDTAVSQVSNLIAQARGIALESVGATGGATAAETAVLQFEQILRQMIDIGNQQFRGRYLFAGSTTTRRPFELVDGVVAYRGNAETILSYSDIDVLFETNVHGDAMFGAISEAVQAGVDLNPRLTADTRLRDLYGGRGIAPGSLSLSNGTQTGVVDIDTAETVGDVAGLLERGLPNLRVEITATGLNLELTSAGDLTVKEVGGGTTAHELGIFQELGAGIGPIVGTDLNPQVTKTTRLDDILGVRASARLPLPGSNNDLAFEAALRGPAFNDVDITFVHGGPGTAGAETAVYDDSNPLNKTLTITIEHRVSTAQQVIAAVNAEGTFIASLGDDEANLGTGVVPATALEPLAAATTAGGAGIEFDQAAGMRIVNGGQTYTIDTSAAQTVEDLLNRLNGAGASVLAEINADGTGINVRSRLNGADFSIGENGGATATQLGLRTFTGGTRLDELNHGNGVRTAAGDDFRIRRKDGVVMGIDVSAAQTIGDVIALINSDAEQDADPAKRITARLALFGNGIELVTSDPAGTATFAVLPGTSAAAEGLGLIPVGASISAPAASAGGTDTITGRDVRPFEGEGIFHALVRLRDAFKANDVAEIERAVALLDGSFTDLNFARAELGARQQALDVLHNRLEDEDVDLQGALSKELDVDLVQAISDLTARQATFDASLQLTAKTAQLTLLDFI